MSAPLLRGFPPVIDQRARVLILGSFPSVQSLAVGQYYANPRNAFWPITAELFGFDATAPYETRLAALQSAGVALWDVVQRCRRAGSADAAIEPKSLVVNDFGELYARYPAIARVYFNGAKAAELYRRLAQADDRIQYRRLPSTSPAHAVPPHSKLAAWREIASIASAAKPGDGGTPPRVEGTHTRLRGTGRRNQ
ncbi:DNA-deoxyinosine glycosylase [Mycobacterium sp. HNNTM2301]|uniref:DNA-deoxyinosine glycosylase n=1 Tax=Mycobacterium hainanense TaxID=3289775 RepID=UPI0035A64245